MTRGLRLTLATLTVPQALGLNANIIATLISLGTIQPALAMQPLQLVKLPTPHPGTAPAVVTSVSVVAVGGGGSSGGGDAVRIIWPGTTRQFPSTGTADQ